MARDLFAFRFPPAAGAPANAEGHAGHFSSVKGKGCSLKIKSTGKPSCAIVALRCPDPIGAYTWQGRALAEKGLAGKFIST